MRILMKLHRAAFVAPILFVLGCAVDPVGGRDDSEEVESTEQALGSTKSRVDISTWNALVAMVPDGNYRLTADINASGKTWNPSYFSGTFDGNGKTISNLTLNVSGDAGFFRTLNQAIVKNVRFTNLSVTGTWMAGGLAGLMQDSQVERVAVEGTVTAAYSVGGIFGHMVGGSLHRSYAKGTVQSAQYFAGGLAGFVGVNLGTARISQSYAQVAVSPNTSDANRTVRAGGIAGYARSAEIRDVYALGNVTGRNGVGGLVGYLDCQDEMAWLLYRGIYRGDVVDQNAPNGGWAGTVGAYAPCHNRFSNLFWDRSLDPSSNFLSVAAQLRGTTAQLRNATTASGGFFCLRPENCDQDGNFESTVWDAGTSTQHHVLKSMPGPNVQPR